MSETGNQSLEERSDNGNGSTNDSGSGKDGIIYAFRSIFSRDPMVHGPSPHHLGPSMASANFTGPLGTILSLANTRKLALLQSRVDRHEVELHALQTQIDFQRQVITRLVTLGHQLRSRLGVGEAAYARLLKLTKVLVLELHILQMHLRRDKAVRETLWRLQLGRLWQRRGKLLQVLILLFICHGALRWGQIYNLQSTISSFLLRPLLPSPVVRKMETVGNSVILLGSFLLCQNFYQEIRSSFPFTWLLTT